MVDTNSTANNTVNDQRKKTFRYKRWFVAASIITGTLSLDHFTAHFRHLPKATDNRKK